MAAEKQIDAGRGNGSGFTFMSFVWRFLAALLLVLVTFNPSGHSAWHLTAEAIRESAFGPLNLILVTVLAICWIAFGIATWRALNALGVILGALLLGGIVWLLVDIGLIKTDSTAAVTWIVLVCLAALLAIGLSWSHVWRRVTGQYKVDDVED